ncbi:glyoxalase [Taibaiella sp. KBW10]|uniref:VOC family protein n=1 Tax=Taibaiella sp. KBW10 TaxID=2153357 RepID=UPI000F5B43F8|nr:VOC family protein [Taibaiella sp. KBW10]RQO30819.1 glyoxalase [Taibaiella sp. KBW10]
MNIKMIWANLAVEDLERTGKFYEALGFRPNGHNNSEELRSFFMGENNFIIHFFVKEQLEVALKGSLADTRQGNEVIFSLSAESEEEVREWVSKVDNAGGTIFAPPEKWGKGFNLGFSDPDGHKFNVLYWPK